MLGSPEKIPFPKKPKSLQFDKYEEFLILVKQQWIELCETYILPGSPRQIAIPAADAKAIEELMDMGHFHPDILSEIYFGIYDRLFQEFQSFVERQKLLATFESESSRRNSTQLKDELSLSTPITAKVAPNENSDADLSQGRPAKKLSIVSNRSASGNGARKVLAVVTNASANSNTLISPPGLHTATPLPEISFEQVISNTAPSPFSRKDYLEYLESLRSEENLEFLIEVLAYRKLAEKFYQPANAFKNTMEMHEQASSLPQATKPAELDEAKYLVEFNALKIIAIDLVDNFLKPSAPKEVNLPSKVQKPLIMLSESGHYNPEVFAEAYSHIYDMLHQNEFVKFLKHALILSSPISSEGILFI